MGRVEAFERSRKVHPAPLWLLFAFVLLLPQFFGVKQGGYDHKQFPLLENVGYATAFIADEPHYMTVISSVVNDGDLDLKNNYASSHQGGFDSGVRFRAFPLDHHAYYFLPEGYTWWEALVERDRGGYIRWWQTGEAGDGITFRYKQQYQHIADLPEYGWHPPVIPVLGYPLLRWFKGSPLLEPAAIFLGYLVTLLAAAFVYWCFGNITQSVLVRFAAISFIFLASPLWHYSRKLLTEPYLAAFLICAFACFYRGQSFQTRYLGGPMFIGLAMMVKSFTVLALLPVFYSAVRARQWLAIVAMGVGPFLGGCAVLYWHYLQTGNPLVVPSGGLTQSTAASVYYMTPAVFFPNAFNIVFATQWGLLSFCPALIPAAYGWWQLLTKRAKQTGLALLMALPYFLFFCFYTGVRDGVNYGPRYMVAILPLLLFGIIGFLAYARLSRLSTKLMWALLAISFLINAPAAIGSWLFGTRHPIQALF